MAVRPFPQSKGLSTTRSLAQQLADLGPFSGPKQLVQELDASTALPWLAAQQDYPKAYWQRRDEQLELAGVGAVTTFTSAEDASDALTACAAFPLLLMAVVPFDPTNTESTQPPCFFLPRLLWQREPDQNRDPNSHKITLKLNLWVDDQRPFEQELKAAKKALARIKPATLNTTLPEVLAENNVPAEGQWTQQVEQALAEQPALSKVVLARRQQLTTATPCDPWYLLDQWRKANQHSSPFAFQLAPERCFIGCTPERLFRREGHQLTSEAVAGTDVRPKDPLHARIIAMALLGDGKNRRENRIVLDDILSQLGPLCEALSYDDKARVLKLNRLQHLKREIRARLRPKVRDDQLLERLHPTPAVGGTPKADALQFIADHEPFQRGWYAGAIGYMSHAHSEFSVAIRSALVDGCQLALFSGAGIVEGSDAGKEWQELNNKLATVRSLMDQE
ncbi:isochorismate synthase MenF [Corallincola platygyrae]|uniref:Isochorismate synthase MenF n=1 Tax=Corallincola platygyrae TaxID=1193278 RepID=A0ABW4XL13_9GAMM